MADARGTSDGPSSKLAWVLLLAMTFWFSGCSKSRSLADLSIGTDEIPAHELQALSYLAAGLQLSPEEFDIEGHLEAESSCWIRQGAVRGVRLAAPPFASLELLSAFDHLERIEIDGGTLASLEGLGSCSELLVLWVRNARVDTVRGLEGCSNLRDVSLRNNRLTSLEELGALPALRVLDVANNRIRDPSGIGDRSKLESIDLSDNQLETVVGLERLPSLRDLNLARNELEDLAGLDHLPELKTLFVDDNRLHDASSLDRLDSLELVNLSGNELRWFPALVSNLPPHLWSENPGSLDRLAADFDRDRRRLTEYSLAPTLPSPSAKAAAWSRGACQWIGRSPHCSVTIPKAAGTARVYLTRFELGQTAHNPRRYPPGIVIRISLEHGRIRVYLERQARARSVASGAVEQPEITTGYPYIEATPEQPKALAGTLMADGSGVWFELEVVSADATNIHYEIEPGFVP